MHRLFSFAKPEVHRVLVPRFSARCLKVTWPTGEQQPKIAPVESEFAITPTIRRLNMKAVTFENLAVFLSNCHLLSPQIDAVPIESIDCATVKAGHELIIPSIFSYVNPWRINIFRADRFKLKHVAVQRLLPDDFKGFGLTITCHKFTSTFVTPTVFSFVDRANGIIGAHVNHIDSNEIVVKGGVTQSFESHFDGSTTVKIESVLQLPYCSIIEVSKPSTTLIKFDKHDDVTIKTKIQVFESKIVSAIQSWRDFPAPFKLKIINRTNAVIPPVLCERYGISWRFINANGNECLDFNIHSPVVWFKLSDESLNRGRLAKKINDGIYLLVVPHDWECLNGASPCFVFNEQELLAVDHWRGYLIHVDKSLTECPSFKTSSGVKKICGWQKLIPSPRVLTPLELHRLRWGIADEHSDKTRINWQNKPIEIIEESYFAAISLEALWVHIPKTTQVDSIYAGFNPRKLRHKKGIFPIALRDFCNTAERLKNGAIFYLWIRDSRCEHKVAVLKVKTKAWHCKLAGCLFISTTWDEAVLHFREVHSEYGFRTLLYSEAQEKGLCNQDIPAKIYLCGYNDQYFVNAVSHADNPTSAIIHHIQYECVNALAQANGGLRHVRFRVIYDAEEIRSVYMSKPTDWAECLLCQNQSDNRFYNNIFSHLMNEHKGEIFEWK